eukprot:5165637-Pleurochrysis_carterae.AAC.1
MPRARPSTSCNQSYRDYRVLITSALGMVGGCLNLLRWLVRRYRARCERSDVARAAREQTRNGHPVYVRN